FLADQLVLAAGLAAADQGGDAASDHILLAVAGDQAEGFVDGDQQVVRVEDDDALAGRLEHGGGQALLLFALLPGADVTARAEHAQHTALGVALYRAATVLDPHPAAVGVADAVFHRVAFAPALHVLDQG